MEEAIKKSALSDTDKALLLGRYSRAHTRLRRGLISVADFEREVAGIMRGI